MSSHISDGFDPDMLDINGVTASTASFLVLLGCNGQITLVLELDAHVCHRHRRGSGVLMSLLV